MRHGAGMSYPACFTAADTSGPLYSPAFAISTKVDKAIGALALHLFEPVADAYEADHDTGAHRIEWRDRSGFWSWNSGGFELFARVDLGYLSGTGKRPTCQALRDRIDAAEAANYGHAIRCTAEEFPNVDLTIGYNELHEAGHGDAAERLSECESESMAEDVYFFTLRVCYFAAGAHGNESGADEIFIGAGVDFGDFDKYGSRKRPPMWSYEKTLPLAGIKGAELRQAIADACATL